MWDRSLCVKLLIHLEQSIGEWHHVQMCKSKDAFYCNTKLGLCINGIVGTASDKAFQLTETCQDYCDSQDAIRGLTPISLTISGVSEGLQQHGDEVRSHSKLDWSLLMCISRDRTFSWLTSALREC